MFRYILATVSLAMIWPAWGIWPMLVSAGLVVAVVVLTKPDDPRDISITSEVVVAITVIFGVYAVLLLWNEPAYTAAAGIIAVQLYLEDLRS